MISIHTSAKEVTSSFVIALSSVPDFNPHFREGSDVPGSPYPRSQWQFQSTLPRRKWRSQGTRLQSTGSISIHTSAKEVTKRIEILQRDLFDFNPHFREGSDICKEVTPEKKSKFQSTLPRRKWRIVWEMSVRYFRFQSTLPRRKWL